MCFDGLELFRTSFPWRGNLKAVWYDQTEIDWESHPSVPGVIIFRRRLVLNQLDGPATDAGQIARTNGRGVWSVTIDLWIRDWDWLAGEWVETKLPELVNRETNVS